MQQKLRVGVISSVHGVHGEVKVFPTTDDPARFRKLKKVWLDTGREEMELEIEQVKFFKQMVIVKFKGWDKPEDSLHYRGKDLFIDRKDAVACAENEYFIADLIGMKVQTEKGDLIGECTEVLSTGANDIYVVSREGKKELMLPAIGECILKVDTEAGMMTVHIMEGLEDL